MATEDLDRTSKDAKIPLRQNLWSLISCLGLLLAFVWPVIWGAVSPPVGWQLYRNFAYGGDYTQYRSAMLQGYDGAWLIINRFTPEPHRAILQYSLYVLLGHIARWLRLPLEVPYVLTSALALMLLVFMLYTWGSTFLPNSRERRWALLLMLSVGPAWAISILKVLLPATTFLTRYSNAFNRQEVNTFLLLSAAPHLPLSLALLLLLVRMYYRHLYVHAAAVDLKAQLTYVGATLLLALLNPFVLPTLLIPLALWWGLRCLRAQALLWQESLPLWLMGLTALPFVIYSLLIFTRDPFWGQAYGSQNYQVSFPLDVVLVGYGALGVLAILGAVRLWRSQALRFLPFWAIVVFALGYLPLTYQRRLSLGLGPALAVMATVGWNWVAQSRLGETLKRWRVTRVVTLVFLVLLLWGQNLIFYTTYAMSYLGTGPTPRFMFQPQALATAAEVLNHTGDDVVVLTCEDLGNALAGEIRGRVVLGHAGATLDVQHRRQEIAVFFDAAMSPAQQAALLDRYSVTHMLISEVDTLICGATYVAGPAWSLVFSQDDIRLYARSVE